MAGDVLLEISADLEIIKRFVHHYETGPVLPFLGLLEILQKKNDGVFFVLYLPMRFNNAGICFCGLDLEMHLLFEIQGVDVFP